MGNSWARTVKYLGAFSLIGFLSWLSWGYTATPKPLPRKAWKQWTQIQPCISGPDPYNNAIPGGTTSRWFSRVTADGTETWVRELPYWPEGCKLFDVELDGDVDLRDVWRLLP